MTFSASLLARRSFLVAPTLAALALLLCATHTSVSAVPAHRIQTRSTRLCGQDLADAVALICGGNYASPLKRGGTFLDRLTTKIRTKSDYNGVQDWGQEGASDDYPHEDSEYLETKSSFSLLSGPQSKRGEEVLFNRNVRGIVEECCHKSCSISQMRQYCGAGKRSGPPLAMSDLDPIK